MLVSALCCCSVFRFCVSLSIWLKGDVGSRFLFDGLFGFCG